MKLKIDENLPCECADILRGGGFDADTVADERLSGAEDSTIADHCRSEGRVLITLDLDFANIRAYPPAEYAGIIILRSKKQDKPAVLTLVYRIAWSWRTVRRKVSFGSWNPIAYDFGMDREVVRRIRRERRMPGGIARPGRRIGAFSEWRVIRPE